jgi:hypothetical protein
MPDLPRPQIFTVIVFGLALVVIALDLTAVRAWHWDVWQRAETCCER